MCEIRLWSEHTEIQIFANPDDENARCVLLRAWTLLDWFPSIGSWNMALTRPAGSVSEKQTSWPMEGTPYQNCHARPGRTANDQKKRDDKADSNADLDTPNNCKKEGKTHERHVNPCAHPGPHIREI